MSDQADEMVFVVLRRLDGKFDKFADDMCEVTQRLGLLGEQAASLSRRIDGLDVRLERVERRLELVAV